METGFLNKHDSEYFSSDVNYDQSNGFESEGSFFSSLINECNNEFEEFQWGIPDGGTLNDSTLNIIAAETPVHQDDFNRSFNEWQQHISNLKLKEEDDLFSDDKIPDIFPSLGSPRQLTSPLQPLLDDSLDPDDLIEVLTDSPASSDDPLSNGIPPTADIRIKIEPGTRVVDTSETFQIKQESSDIAELLDFNLPHNDYDRSLPGISSTELGPDNYDVVDIKVEKEDDEDDEVDVETVSETTPVIEANDITTLLDQFEATERFNKLCKHKMKDLDGPKVPPLIIKKTNSQLKVEPAPSPKASPPSGASPASPFSVPRNAPVNKTIIDSLPKEVIERIKKSSEKKKKIVPVVPAEPLPAKGNGHMKDAGGASRSKIRELINKKKVKTELAQVDHDYCTNDSKISQEPPRVDPASKKKPVLPPKPPVTVVVDAFSVTEEDKWVLDNEQKLLTTLPTASPSPSEASSNARNSWEKNSKRDSGLESGDVSDASESPLDKKIPLKAQTLRVESAAEIRIENEDCPPTPEAASPQTHSEVPNATDGANEAKKKKLNLDEYRTRRKFARLSSPIKSGTIGEAILSNKWVQRPAEEKEVREEKKAVVRVEANFRVPPPEMRVDASPKKYEDEKRRRNSRSHERTKTRYRHRSSSSSSSGSRVRSSRLRGRSRDKRRATRRSHSRNRQWSRSRSRSSSSSSSSSSSRSRSRSGSRSRCSRSSRYRRSRSRSRSSYRRSSNRRYSHSSSSSNRFSSDRPLRRPDDWNSGERQKQVEERRVIYVGQIEEGTTKSQLRERFQLFGPIVDISLHFRERGDNYGFVTFAYKGDAYKAVEHGNDNPLDTRYEICFGGRRAFCKQRYADLDSMAPQTTYSPYHQSRSNESFDSLLRAAQEKLLRGQKAV